VVAQRLRPLRLWLRDRLYAARHRAGGRRILVLRHRDQLCHYNDDLLAWLLRTAPGAAGLFELRRVGFVPKDPVRYALLVPWLQDPLRERFPEAYELARRVEEAIRTAGGAVVNPVESLSHSIKSIASARLRAAGVPMPPVVPLPPTRELPAGLAFPVIAREDRRHGGPMHLCHDQAELARVPWHELRDPVLTPFRDVRGDDGLYRKWRYVVAGDGGAPRHLVVSRDWVVRAEGRVEDEAAQAEELAYTRSLDDPQRAILVRGARALDLDVVAFDYARTRSGELVVFEPNPFAVLWAPFNDTPRYRYQRPCVERVYATLCLYWLARAGLTESANAMGDVPAIRAIRDTPPATVR
jgi:hypothetical protein